MSSRGCKALDPTPSQIDKSAFFEGAQKSTEVSGTSYGIPWYVETRVVFYRSDLAKKAGFDTVPTDQAGLKEMAKAMQTKAGAKWGIGLQAGGTGSWQTLMPFAWSNGADLTKDGGKAYNFDSPEILEATKYYQSFFTDGISDKAAPATPTTEPDFASGKVPMFISGPWEMSAVEKVGGAGFKDKYNVAPDPGRARLGRPRSSAAPTSPSSRARRTATPRGSSCSGSPTPRSRRSGTRMSTDLPSVKSAWQDPSSRPTRSSRSSASSSRPPSPRRRSRHGSRSSPASTPSSRR